VTTVWSLRGALSKFKLLSKLDRCLLNLPTKTLVFLCSRSI
jgi:hypothetical protein